MYAIGSPVSPKTFQKSIASTSVSPSFPFPRRLHPREILLGKAGPSRQGGMFAYAANSAKAPISQRWSG